MGLPHYGAINDALGFDSTRVGLTVLGGEQQSRYRVQNPSELYTAPKGWEILTVAELVKLRVASMTRIVDEIGIDLENLPIQELNQVIEEHSGKILSKIRMAPEWTGRFNTRTMTLRAGNGRDALIVDVNGDAYRSPDLVKSYSELRDGGGELKLEEIPGEVVGQIDGDTYCDHRRIAGGDKSIKQLYNHPVVMALIPDETMRDKYLGALGTLNKLGFFKTGSNSIWVPDKLPKWFFRWHALGFEADAFYPPNLGTEYFELFMEKSKE